MTEGWLTWHAAGRTTVAIKRMEAAFLAGKNGGSSLFGTIEIAALRLAWLSAHLPLTTPRRFIRPVIDAYGPAELVRLVNICGLAGLVQRFSAVMKPKSNDPVRDFFADRSLATDTLTLRYPETIPLN